MSLNEHNFDNEKSVKRCLELYLFYKQYNFFSAKDVKILYRSPSPENKELIQVG